MKSFDDDDIAHLIGCPKDIVRCTQRAALPNELMMRGNMDLVSAENDERFQVFMRKSIELVDSFSLGLMYVDRTDGSRIILFRCNGPHGPPGIVRPDIPYHAAFHIHRATAANIAAGLKPESGATETRAYASYEEALDFFMEKCHIVGAERYFPKLAERDLGQPDLFEDPHDP